MKRNSPRSNRFLHESTEATDLARRAGSLLLENSRTFDHSKKGKLDLVTSTDVMAEEFLATELERRFPSDRILAEESAARRVSSPHGRCWVIDPLDGTVNFASGLSFFSVSIALLEDGIPQVGVVYDPQRQELFSARRGFGAALNGQPMSSLAPPLCTGVSTGFLNWCARTKPSTLDHLISSLGKLRILGSQALHLCYVACGRLAATLSTEARLWDDAAGALVVDEMDFVYSGFDGNQRFPIATDSPWLRGKSHPSLAAPPVTHRQLVTLLNDRHSNARSS